MVRRDALHAESAVPDAGISIAGSLELDSFQQPRSSPKDGSVIRYT
ncbi:MAG: hypothetical protein ACP5E5_07705 [Acidobacteriaceae bacterium]